jgi:5-methylthioadenosine/S-adenosylhomocysteine deaminase
MTIHQSPRQGQVDQCLKEHGMRPLEYLNRIGVLGPNMLLGHAIRLDDNEVEIMARTDTMASMSPVTSMRLGFGTAGYGKLPEMLAAGVTVGLGTDTTDFGIADMLKTAELASLLYKDAREDTSLISPEKALEMITIDGAKACGLDEQVGSLEVGKKADLVVFDTTRAEWQPLLNPVHALIYHADGRSVETVMVDGRTVVDDGRPTFVDEAALGAQLQADAEGLLERTGIVVTPRWPIIG